MPAAALLAESSAARFSLSTEWYKSTLPIKYLTLSIAYNAQARAYNGALTLVAFITIAAMAFNYNNLLAYLPLLNMCASYQITHYFVNHRYERQYAAVLGVCGAYVLLYLWRITL